MRGIFLFGSLLDILYHDTDEELKLHLFQQAVKVGIVKPTTSDGTAEEKYLQDVGQVDVGPDIISHLFQPLIASQIAVTEKLKSPYQSLCCGNGMVFVFSQIEECWILAIGDDGEEAEEFLNRQIIVFKRLIGLKFGPVTYALNYGDHATQQRRTKLLSGLLRTWCDLSMNDQAFLVEAVEKLHVSQPVSDACLDLLEAANITFRTFEDKPILHAALVVHSKILAMRSSRNSEELVAADSLMLDVLVNYLNPPPCSEECPGSDAASIRSPSTPHTPRPHLLSPDTQHRSEYPADSETSSDGSEQFYDSVSEIYLDDPHTSSQHSGNQSREPSISNTYDSRSSSEVSVSGMRKSSSFSSKEGLRKPSSLQIQESLSHSLHQHSLDQDEADQHDFTLMLSTCTARYTPYHVHVLRLMDGISLLLITEAPQSKHSALICRLLNLLEVASNPGSNRGSGEGRPLFDQLESNVKKLVSGIRKLKGHFERMVRDFGSQWELVRKRGFQTYLEKMYPQELPAELESPVSELTKKLKTLFRRLYLDNGSPVLSRSARQALDEIQGSTRQGLMDYQEYLHVRAIRNITLTSYLPDFPGLVHFLFIDRFTDQITAPSLNVTKSNEPGKCDATHIIKAKVWESFRWIQTQLAQGSTSVSARDSDFVYTYSLFFKDKKNILALQQPFRGLKSDIPPGILTGHFYRQMASQCFHNVPQQTMQCYEILCIHTGQVSPDEADRQCQQLLAHLTSHVISPVRPVSLL